MAIELIIEYTILTPIMMVITGIMNCYIKPIKNGYNYFKRKLAEYQNQQFKNYAKQQGILEEHTEEKIKRYEEIYIKYGKGYKWFQMKNEIISAANLIVYIFEIGLLIDKLDERRRKTKLTKEQIEKFRYCLILNMYSEFSSTWYPEQPEKGGSLRFLRLDGGERMRFTTDTNTVVKDAMKMAKIDNYIQEHVFPTKFVVFINPGQVFFCLMTYNTFYHLYNSKPIMSENIELTRNPWNLSIYRRKDLDILAKKEGVAVGRHYISTMKKNLKSFSHHGATNYIIPEKEIHDRHTYHEWMFEY